MVRRIQRSELNELSREFHFSIEETELSEYEKLTEFVFGILDGLDIKESANGGNVTAVREPGHRPKPEEDPFNAVVRWCHVKANLDGPLSGKRIGLKDAIAVAGVPMTCGSGIMQGFVPTVDSVITDRLLRAGATITAITNMDNLAFSGGGDTSTYGSTLNPFDQTRTAGGSSGGSAAALFYDRVDAAIGADQGGSIRIPAAWCGVIGLKPTHSLVPYVGIAGIDQTFDHCGPLALTVEDAALLLQVIAGRAESDPRQRAGVQTKNYVQLVSDARAQNLRPGLTAAYDRVLGEVDFLLMPTTPGRAHVDNKSLSISEHVMRGWSMLSNTAPFDMTGHPALTIPAGESGGLPVGVMLVGRQFQDGEMLGFARTYEKSFGWVPEHPAAAVRNRTAAQQPSRRR